MARSDEGALVGTGVSVRAFREEDRARLRWIFLLSRQSAFHFLVDKHYVLTDFDHATAGEDVWVAEITDEVVGFASVWAEDSFVHNLFVHPDHAGRGAGTALLARLSRHYAPPLTLKCLKENTPALRFYRRLGWYVESDGIGSDGEYFDLSFHP
jgi:ribosomal protein S18 acetylase RimI-like enzyme